MPVDVGVPVDGLERERSLRNVETRLLLAQDVLSHQQRLHRQFPCSHKLNRLLLRQCRSCELGGSNIEPRPGYLMHQRLSD